MMPINNRYEKNKESLTYTIEESSIVKAKIQRH